MANKKPVKNKTKALIVKRKKEVLWLGAQRLMNEAVTPKEKQQKEIIIVTARVLNVSPFGINILGNLPYINKLGLAQKASQYEKNVIYKYKWVHIAKDDTEKAICKCKVTDGKKDLSDWILGECSQVTMSMGTLKGYQNHMAQTRAKNRAIQETFGVRIHEEMIRNVELLHRKGAKAGIEVKAIGGAVTTSAEEMVNGVNKNAPARPTPNTNTVAIKDKKIAELKARAKGRNDKEKAIYISKMTNFVIDEKFNISQGVATLALARLLDAESKK